ncbi:MAG: polyprenyl diphosphate synthase [Clostridia bacterium]|nr:polyprenyl diphosphate synthase [Clostridia bacterium]
MNIFSNKSQKLLDANKLPHHIAFIIDGNGRWAKKKGLPRTVGHSFGVKAVADTVQNCVNLGIKYMSFYAFSTENWNRPQDEVDAIFELLRDYIKQYVGDYENKNIKVMTSGDITKLPKDIYETIEEAKEKTKHCTDFVLNIALNYGGRDEIIRGINQIIKDGVKDVSKESFKTYLYTKNLPDPDLIVRTSGEFRTSNFMPYQAVYSEWAFPKTYWPDFNNKQLIKILLNFQKRDRRFGAIKKEEKK